MKCTCQEQSACSSCQPSIVERQERVVRAMQDLILRFGNAPSGQLKDMAIALGVAVDKLVLLRPRPAPQQFYSSIPRATTATNLIPPKPENT